MSPSYGADGPLQRTSIEVRFAETEGARLRHDGPGRSMTYRPGRVDPVRILVQSGSFCHLTATANSQEKRGF